MKTVDPTIAYDEVNQYLNHIEKIRRYSRHTLIAYRTDLRQFSNFYKGNLINATERDVRNFQIHLRTQNYSNRSINRKFEVIRSFYRHHRRHNGYKNFPCSRIKKLRFIRVSGSYLTKDVIHNTLNAIQPGENREIVRDLLILELLYQTGCRANELINLKRDNIDLQRKVIKVVGKGKFERLLPIGGRLIRLIKKQSKLWEGKNRTDYLISTDKGKQMYPMCLWRLIRKYFKTASAHTLRHSFAAHLYQNGAPITAIRDLLGHRWLSTTTIYLHLEIETLIAIHKRSHPRA